MFNDWVGVAPLRFTLVMRVHYRTGYENAFWNGTSMTFGDGASKYYPFVDVNLSAHEVSHGFTQQNSGLFYRSESGGINEAFADITGEAAEFYWKGTVDWIVGAAITKNSAGLRFFRKPHLGWCLDRAFKGLPCWARRSLQQRYL
jgi:vibriolysin